MYSTVGRVTDSCKTKIEKHDKKYIILQNGRKNPIKTCPGKASVNRKLFTKFN